MRPNQGQISNIEMETKLAFQYNDNKFVFTMNFNVSIQLATHVLNVAHQHGLEQILVNISPMDALAKLPNHVLDQIAKSITIPAKQKAVHAPYARHTYHHHGAYGATPQDPTTIDKIIKVTDEKMEFGPTKTPETVYVCLCESTSTELKSYVFHEIKTFESLSPRTSSNWHYISEA